MSAIAETLRPPFVKTSALLEEAFAFCELAHEGMRRKAGGDPFVNHPVRVAAACWYANLDDECVAAALLHDVVEDTAWELEDIRMRFGDAVAELVDALSEDKSTSDYEQRKSDHLNKLREAGWRACAVFCADKLTNLKDMVMAYEVEDERLADRFNTTLDHKVAHTRHQLDMLAAIPEVSELPLLSEFERVFEAFQALRGSSARRALPA